MSNTRIMKHAWLAVLLLASFRAEPDLSKLDPHLRRLAQDPAAAAQPVRAIVRLEPGHARPAIPGATFGARAGDFVTVRTTAGALATIAADPSVAQVLRERKFRPRSLQTTIGARGAIAAAETDVFTFAGVAGQTARIRVHAETGALDTQVAADDTALTGDDAGPGTDAELTVTWATTAPKSISVSATAGTGGYLLLVTVDGSPAATDLTGAEITGANPAFVLGSRAFDARAAFGVDGSGVAIGIVDTGIDHTHADFRDGAGNTRLLSIWDQTITPAGGEASPSFGYGVEYPESAINADLGGGTPLNTADTDGHGTHVAGIAAGDDAAFTGAAPGARIIVVKTDFSETGIIDGINYVFAKAAELGFDGVVVNLSLGTHDGPHDGTGALDVAVDNSVDRGKYVVVAAGNEGDDRIHAQASIAPSGAATWTFTPSVVSVFTVNDPHVIDIWAHGSDQYTVTVTDTTDATVTLTTVSGASGTFGPNITVDVEFITIENKTDAPSNGATHIRVEIQDASLDPFTITLTRTQNSGSGVVDGYVGSETGTFAVADVPTLADGTFSGTVSEPGTAKRAITIGAFRGLFAWDNLAATTTRQANGTGAGVPGFVASFSSRGPTRDGRAKPDLSAPGAYLGSSLSTDATTPNTDDDADGVHTYLEGTSMAAPMVSGILALLLQRNRILLPEDVLALLISTAAVDATIALSVANSIGAGKVNAMGVVGGVPVQEDVSADGSCFSSVPAASFAWWLLLLPLLAFRNRKVWAAALVLACALPLAAQDDPDVDVFGRVHGGGWMSGEFDFEAFRLDGVRDLDSRGMAILGVDAGVRLFEHYLIFATGEYGLAGDLSALMFGGGIGYTHVLSEDDGPWPPSDLTVYLGGLWGRLEVDKSDFGEFDDAFGFRAGVSLAFRPWEHVFMDFFLEYRLLKFDYEEDVIGGDDSIGGSGVAFGLGIEFRFGR